MQHKRYFTVCVLIFMISTLIFSIPTKAETNIVNPEQTVNSVCITGNHVNIRTGPSTKYPIIDTLPKGTILSVTETDSEDIWYKVIHQNKPAFIYSQYCKLIYTPTDTIILSENSNINLCEPDGNVDQTYIDHINEQLKIVPTQLKQQFINDGWHLYCTDKDIDSYWYNGQYGAVRGTTNYDENAIYIEDRDKAVETAVLHEFGHYIDWTVNYIHTTPAFIDIYQKESNTFCNTFLIDFYYDEQEFFAEAFDKYLTDPETLQTNCPMIYQCLDNIVP